MLERCAVRLVPEPKPRGVRWLARLDGPTASAYAAAVGPFVAAIEAALPPNVVAHRVERVDVEPPAIHLEPWRAARIRFGAQVRGQVAGAAAALMADVRDCYGSISAEVVEDTLRRLGGRPERAAAVRRILERLQAEGVRGLPVGPEPSAVLANAVLLSVDRRLGREGLAHVRWVDDVIVALSDAAAAAGALATLEEALADLGLELAPHKTRVVLDPTLVTRAAHVRASGPIRRPDHPSG